VIEVNRKEYEALVTYVRTPQTEIVRAFKNRYLRALGMVFMITLALMIYLIAKTLRPLRVLSASCAEISEGKLRNVEARGNSSEIVTLEETFNRMVESLKDKEVVEANLRQAQRLAAIGNLAAGVAHDVRNPLNAIKLISSHTLDTVGDSPESEPVAKQLRTIRNEVDRLDDIVSGFLSLAKEEELRLEPHQIDELLEQCARLVAKDAESRGVHLIEELRAGDATLDIDPKQWTRAILNVLINALEACPAGGRVRFFSRVTDDLYEIEIRDDGSGMNAEALEQAFDPYFTTKTTGTGLGLAITRGIVEEHGGTIAISSQEGRGCQVLITIPRNAAHPRNPVMDIARVTAKLKPSDVNVSGLGNIS
jgi:signal transduction histidine kinase